MQLSQHDIAQLTDRQVKILAIRFHEYGSNETDPNFRMWRAWCVALVKALRERRRLVLLAESSMLEDEEPGSLLEDDPEIQKIIRESGDAMP